MSRNLVQPDYASQVKLVAKRAVPRLRARYLKSFQGPRYVSGAALRQGRARPLRSAEFRARGHRVPKERRPSGKGITDKVRAFAAKHPNTIAALKRAGMVG